jgi:hypothetical protein
MPPSRIRLGATALLVGAVQLLCGCTLATNIAPDKPLTIDGDSALLLASATMEYEGQFFARTIFLFRGVGGGKRFRLDSAVPWTIWPMLEALPEPGLESVQGRLYAFEVPPGEYELVEVAIHDSPTISTRPKARYRFTARAGVAVYIGNFDVRLCHRLTPKDRWPYYIVGGLASVRDKSGRDLRLLRAKFPALQGVPIEIEVLDGDAIERMYAGLARKCPE